MMTMSAWECLGSALEGEELFSLAVSSPAVAGANGSAGRRILAGSRQGLHGSDDAGQGWRLMSGALGSFPVMAAAFSPDYPNSPGIFAGGAPGAVLRSFDDGESWEACGLDYPDVVVTGLVTTPSAYAEGVILAGTAEDGIYRSTTRGRYWQTANFGLYDLRVWSLSISPAWQADQTAFAVVGDGLFHSTIGARAWQTVGIDELRETLPQVVAISPDFGEDGTVFLGTAGEGVWCSRDRGKEWQPAGGSAGASINCLAFSPSRGRERTVYAGTTEHGILVSGDCGRNWQRLSGAELAAVWCLAETSFGEGSVLLAGVQGQGLVRFLQRRPDSEV